jgi:hypothetical protein
MHHNRIDVQKYFSQRIVPLYGTVSLPDFYDLRAIRSLTARSDLRNFVQALNLAVHLRGIC